MLTEFHYSFTGRLSDKFATNWCLNIPPHLKYVATLPSEISVSKNRNTQEVIEANCRVRLNHSKNFYNICLVKYLLDNSLTKSCLNQPCKNPIDSRTVNWCSKTVSSSVIVIYILEVIMNNVLFPGGPRICSSIPSSPAILSSRSQTSSR